MQAITYEVPDTPARELCTNSVMVGSSPLGVVGKNVMRKQLVAVRLKKRRADFNAAFSYR